MMARWLVDIPWEHSAPFEMIEVYAGVARIARFAQACGFSSRAFELKFDEPPDPGMLEGPEGQLLTLMGKVDFCSLAKVVFGTCTFTFSCLQPI